MLKNCSDNVTKKTTKLNEENLNAKSFKKI